MIKIFSSYSHKDEVFRDELGKHLAILKRKKLIDDWYDRRIEAGSDLPSSINTNLKGSDIILLLVSADFLHSDYCYDIEMQEAMKMHERGEAAVIPVILRPCAWLDAPFGKLLALPKDGKPVSSFSNMDEAFFEIVNGIKSRIDSLMVVSEATEVVKSMQSIANQAIPKPRSSNVTITQNFTDLEKDKFLRESFEFIANYFEGSLEELEKKNRGISYFFDRVDSQTFSAAIYRDGKKECECMIFMGSQLLSKGINYSNQISLLKNSLNESMQVVSNGYMLLLKPLGMSSFRVIGDGEITPAGAAEFYWQMLITRLQKR
ncbi:MAG: toll/interleukin-1 receptor domain-containing protein [Bacteroidota bacterium]|nr:toll/interleukin-1 receptor domain-containing protein [Bacteroidota bacterium]